MALTHGCLRLVKRCEAGTRNLETASDQGASFYNTDRYLESDVHSDYNGVGGGTSLLFGYDKFYNMLLAGFKLSYHDVIPRRQLILMEILLNCPCLSYSTT